MTVITALPSGGAEIVNANTAPVLVSAMKQAIVARTDIGMGQGKLAAQVATRRCRPTKRPTASYRISGNRAARRKSF